MSSQEIQTAADHQMSVLKLTIKLDVIHLANNNILADGSTFLLFLLNCLAHDILKI